MPLSEEEYKRMVDEAERQVLSGIIDSLRPFYNHLLLAHGLTVRYSFYKAVFIDKAYTITHPDLRYTDS